MSKDISKITRACTCKFTSDKIGNEAASLAGLVSEAASLAGLVNLLIRVNPVGA